MTFDPRGFLFTGAAQEFSQDKSMGNETALLNICASHPPSFCAIILSQSHPLPVPWVPKYPIAW